MGAMHIFTAFVVPKLTEDFLQFNASASGADALQSVFVYSGISTGIALELYRTNGQHA